MRALRVLKSRFIFLLFLFESYGLCAQLSTEIRLEAGRQTTNFDWSIAGNVAGVNPNILSELIWKDLTGISGKLYAQMALNDKWLIRSNISYTSYITGQVEDTDYAADNRQDITFFGKFDAANSREVEFSFAGGYHFNLAKNIDLSTSIGFIKSWSLFTIQEDVSDLDSWYDAQWYGALVESRLSYSLNRWAFFVNCQYEQLRYFAEANWNLRDDFAQPISFDHTAKGYGYRISFQAAYTLSTSMAVFATFETMNRNSGKGVEHLYFSDGRLMKTQVNGIHHTRHYLGIGLKINFNSLS
ncbi:MAG: hypothetical protein AAF616_12875 [Bacteroidota bacterium]